MSAISSNLCMIAGLFIGIGFGSVSSSYLGSPPYCHHNLLDYYPCSYQNPSQTDTPNQNEYGIYSTRIRNSGCIIRSRDDVVRPIIGNAVKFIHSPGRQRQPMKKYRNQQLVNYNISCPANHIAFFSVLSIDMESANCLPPGYQAPSYRCVDYLQLHQSGVGVSESCGTQASPDHIYQIVQGDFQVIFRTSFTARYYGFQAIVVCINTANNRGNCADNGSYNRKAGMDDEFGVLPNEEELAIIKTLAKAQFSHITEDPLPEESLDPLPQEPIDLAPLDDPKPVDEISDRPYHIEKRSRSLPHSDFKYEELKLAIQNEDACNPVLKTVAQATIKSAEQKEGGGKQIQSIRDDLDHVSPDAY